MKKTIKITAIMLLMINSISVFAGDTITKRDYYKNGQVRVEVPYADGKRNGVVREYYENGQVKSETPYTDNVKDGVVRIYNPNGTLQSETVYTEGIGGVATLYRRRGR
jgi:antitoxin component YwqK of YwqJK toxin-antitoxin module